MTQALSLATISKTIFSKLIALSQSGCYIEEVFFELSFSYPSFEQLDARNKAIEPVFPHLVRPLFVRTKNIPFLIDRISVENPLFEENFIQITASAIARIAEASGICRFQALISPKEKTGIQIPGFELLLEDMPTLGLLDKLTDKKELITEESLAIVPKRTMPLGMQFQSCRYLSHNRASFPESKDESFEVYLHILHLFLRAKKMPLTPKEFMEAKKCLHDTSWRKTSGMCSGFSDLFNAFLFRMLLMTGSIPDDEHLLSEFLASNDLKKITLVTALPYYDPHNLFIKMPNGSMVYSKTLNDCSTAWAHQQEFFQIYYPWLHLSRIEDAAYLTTLETIADQVEALTTKRPVLSNPKGQEAFKQDLEQSLVLSSLLQTEEGSISEEFASLLKIQTLYNEAQMKNLLGRRFCIQESLEIIFSQMQSKNHVCIKISYDHPEGAHAISVASFQDLGKFYYYDANSGVIAFKSIQELIQYSSYVLRNASNIALTFMTDNL